MTEASNQSAKWDAQLRKGTLELAILAAVAGEEKYGLAILNYLHSFETMVISEGTLYPLLDRLKREGVLNAKWHHEGEVRPRKYYSLTESGLERLHILRARWKRSVVDMESLLADSAIGEGNGADNVTETGKRKG
jgi:PadR family transcriptional regulator PadR